MSKILRNLWINKKKILCNLFGIIWSWECRKFFHIQICYERRSLSQQIWIWRKLNKNWLFLKIEKGEKMKIQRGENENPKREKWKSKGDPRDLPGDAQDAPGRPRRSQGGPRGDPGEIQEPETSNCLSKIEVFRKKNIKFLK